MFLYCVKALNASYLVLRSRRNPWQHPTARLIEFLCVSAVSSLLVAAMPRCEGVNESQDRVFPSSERRGGCAIKKMLRSLLVKAQTGWSVPDNVTTSTFTIMTTPSAPLRRLRVFFLLAQPPLLFQEGNTLSWQFIHTCNESVAASPLDPFRRTFSLFTLSHGLMDVFYERRSFRKSTKYRRS